MIGRVAGHADGAEAAYCRKRPQALSEGLRVHLSNLRRRREWHSIVGKVQRQMHAARTCIVGFQDQAARELALDSKIPLRGVWQRTGLGKRRAGGKRIARAKLRQCRLRIFEVLYCDQRHPLRQRKRLRNAGAQTAEALTDGVAGEEHLRAQVGEYLAIEDAESGSDHRAGRDVVSQTHTRRKVQLTGLEIECRGSVDSGKQHLAGGGVDARVNIVGTRHGRLIFITHPEIEGELLRDFPIVLHESAGIVVPSPGRRLRQRVPRSLDGAEKKISQPVHWIAAVVCCGRDFTVKGVVACKPPTVPCSAGIVDIELVLAHIEAELQHMVAPNLCR